MLEWKYVYIVYIYDIIAIAELNGAEQCADFMNRPFFYRDYGIITCLVACSLTFACCVALPLRLSLSLIRTSFPMYFQTKYAFAFARLTLSLIRLSVHSL